MDHYFSSNKYHADKETLITTGSTQSDLMLILNGHATVVREGNNIAGIKRRQFIADISYITGKPASADVISKEGLTSFVWNRSVLNKLRKSKPDTMEKLDRILILDMAGKLIR